MALEAERELEFQRRFTGEVDVGTWWVYLKLLLLFFFLFRLVSLLRTPWFVAVPFFAAANLLPLPWNSPPS